MSDDIDRASYSSRQKQKTDGQPEEAAETFKLTFSSRHAWLLQCYIRFFNMMGR